MPPKPTSDGPPQGLSSAALERAARLRRLNAARESGDAADAAPSSGDAEQVSDAGDEDADANGADSAAARRVARLLSDQREAHADLTTLVNNLDDLLQRSRTNLDEGRAISNMLFDRRMSEANTLHRDASDALQVWYDVSVDVANGNTDSVDPEYTTRHDSIADMWSAIEHTLRRHLETRAPRYEPPFNARPFERSPSVRARDPGYGAAPGRSSSRDVDPGPRSPRLPREEGPGAGVRFNDARVRPGP